MTNELYHFGIKGMKWGVRRYQNPDGTLTAAGKKRQSKQTEIKANRDEKRSRKNAVKNRRTISDEELAYRVNRLEKEKRLRDLTREDLHPGRSVANDILGSAGKKVIVPALAGAAALGGIYAVKHNPKLNAVLGDKVDWIFPKPKFKG